MQVVQELRLALRNDQVEEMSAEYKDQLKRQFPHAVVNFFSSWQGAGGGVSVGHDVQVVPCQQVRAHRALLEGQTAKVPAEEEAGCTNGWLCVLNHS